MAVLLIIFVSAISFFTFLFLQNHSFLFQKELKIALLSGASQVVIAAPYVLFATLLSVFGFIFSLVVTVVAGRFWPLSLFSIPQIDGGVYTYDVFLLSSWWLFLLEFLVLLGISFLSGFFSLRPLFRRLKH